MSQPITLHVMLDDVHDIYNALHNEIHHCERQHTVCQAEACTELVAYWSERLQSLLELCRYLKRKMEAAHDEGLEA